MKINLKNKKKQINQNHKLFLKEERTYKVMAIQDVLHEISEIKHKSLAV